MEIPPSDSRQPPDGHEFPDFIENDNKPLRETVPIDNNFNDFKKLKQVSTKCSIPTETTSSSKPKSTNLILDKSISSSNCDLRTKMYESDDDTKFESSLQQKTNLHTRSQSLIDMSIFSKEKNSKWNSIIEQRRKGLSKLKGLVIPEQTENDVLPSVSIPEIKSYTTNIAPLPKVESNFNNNYVYSSNHNESDKLPLVLPSWSCNTTIPKYSPAFKRKSLQLYPTNNKKNENECIYNNYQTKYNEQIHPKSNKVNDVDELNPPKSLESIASPTRSDCSFDYVSSKRYQKENCDSLNRTNINLISKDLNKAEDESDNDSAVSSSQSSYNSRFSPPSSPASSYEMESFKKFDNDSRLGPHNRLLKPFSVEAINRKNILASAKCRSGKDLKSGSPVIQRKYEKSENNLKIEQKIEEARNNEKCDVPEHLNNAEVKYVSDNKTTKFLTSERLDIIGNEKLNIKQELAKTTTELIPASPVQTNTVKRPLEEELKENNHLSLLEKYSASSILSRRIKPVNVKALKESFENSGSGNVNKPLFPKNFRVESKIVNGNVKIEKPSSRLRNTEVALRKLEEDIKEVSTPEISSSQIRNKEKQTSLSSSKTIELRLVDLGGSLGITLAGGADYENKAITVHRIRYGSVAYQDGRLKKGDKIISVNGKSTEGLSHSAAVELLKEPCNTFSIEIQECEDVMPSGTSRRSSASSVVPETKCPILDTLNTLNKQPNHVISFVKDGAGLGFSIEGGKDSPQGDVPLVIKKIFTGGTAEKCGQLQVGDEIIFINDTNFTNLTRIEAWNLMKKIPDGTVKIQVYR